MKRLLRPFIFSKLFLKPTGLRPLSTCEQAPRPETDSLGPSTMYVGGKYASRLYRLITPLYGRRQIDHHISCIEDGSLDANICQRLGIATSSPQFESLRNEYLGLSSPEVSSTDDLLRVLQELNTYRASEEDAYQLLRKTVKQSTFYTEFEEYKTKVKDFSIKVQDYTVDHPIPDDKEANLVNKIEDLSEHLWKTRAKLFQVEDLIVPILIRIPIRLIDVSDIVRTLQNEFTPVKPSNTIPIQNRLNWNQIAHITGSLSSSLVGPQACYLSRDGAILERSLTRFFAQRLMREMNFTRVSGLDLIRSAIVEASDSQCRDPRDGFTRPIIDQGSNVTKDAQQNHLVGEASLEAMAALMSRRQKSLHNFRLLSSGVQYSTTTDAHAPLTHSNGLSVITVTRDFDDKSAIELQEVLRVIISCYCDLKIPFSFSEVDPRLLNRGEAARIQFSVWLPSRGIFTPVGHLSHHADFLSRRLNMKGIHLIEGTMLNSLPLIKSIMENCQTPSGAFSMPSCLSSYSISN